MEMEKRALSEEKSFNLNEIIENEIQNDSEKCCSCLPKKGRKKLLALTTVIFCTLVISVVIIILHFNSGKSLPRLTIGHVICTLRSDFGGTFPPTVLR